MKETFLIFKKLVRKGDLNAFFGLIVDNMTQLVIMASILVGVFGFPRDIVFYYMIPGSAVGVLIGDLIYSLMAVRLAQKTGRTDITAMPLGIDTPSLFAFTFGVVGPAYLATQDGWLAWKISMGVIVVVGLVKISGSFLGSSIRRSVPRAGLLGPIAGVALLLIAFLPSLKIFHSPLVGLISLIVILTCITGKIAFPFRLPAAFAGVLMGVGVYYFLFLFGFWQTPLPILHHLSALQPVFPFPTLGFLEGFPYLFSYLPLAIPFALVVLVGGIDVTESASASGDEYDTRAILLTDGFSTLMGGLCGGVVQTTPYIGHPAYKEMGGGVGYTFFTALFIGLGGVLGYLGLMVDLLPEAAVAPILVFIGLEIASQAFYATPRAHYKAVVISFLPIIASLVIIEMNSLLGHFGKTINDLKGEVMITYETLLILSNGFIISSLIWGGALSFIIDHRLKKAAFFFWVASLLTLFGVIHSPFPDGRMFFPWEQVLSTTVSLSGAYGLMGFFLLWLEGFHLKRGTLVPTQRTSN
ncbi:MAG TPA: MFS transporter [Nitrospiria bacterium]